MRSFRLRTAHFLATAFPVEPALLHIWHMSHVLTAILQFGGQLGQLLHRRADVEGQLVLKMHNVRTLCGYDHKLNLTKGIGSSLGNMYSVSRRNTSSLRVANHHCHSVMTHPCLRSLVLVVVVDVVVPAVISLVCPLDTKGSRAYRSTSPSRFQPRAGELTTGSAAVSIRLLKSRLQIGSLTLSPPPHW